MCDIFELCGESYKMEIFDENVVCDDCLGFYYYEEYIDMCCGLYVFYMGFC